MIMLRGGSDTEENSLKNILYEYEDAIFWFKKFHLIKDTRGN